MRVRYCPAWDVKELSGACRNYWKTRMEWLVMWQRKGNTLPYVLTVALFRNGIGLLIFWDRPFEICPIWLWIYMRNVRLDHWPIFVMVVFLSLCSFRYMPSPARREWMPTRSVLMPLWWILRVDTDNRMKVIISVGVTVVKVSLPVTLYSQIYNSVLPPLVKIRRIQRVRYLQVQRSEEKFLNPIVSVIR